MISPLTNLIQMLPVIIQGWVSWKRVLVFLREETHRSTRQDCRDNEPDGKPAQERNAGHMPSHVVLLKDANIRWNEHEQLIELATLSGDAGELIVIQGQTGQGKSSLLKALLPFYRSLVTSGSCVVRSSKVSYCDQTPWFIPDVSIRENIILENVGNQRLYEAVIRCCCLLHDFSAFDEGDGKIVPDSAGTSLSGGQRKRISLARALYNEPTLLILDDVFAGLDSQTQRSIERSLFGPSGFITQRRTMSVVMTRPSLGKDFLSPSTATTRS